MKMKPALALVLIFILSLSKIGECANILFYFGVSTYSHRIIVWPLVEKLSSRGHNVSFLSPFPIKNPHPNITDLVPEELTEIFTEVFDTGSDIIGDRFRGNRNIVWSLLPSLGLRSCSALLQSEKWKNWISSSHYDLIIVDAMYGECALGLGLKFGAKVAFFKTNTVYPWEFDLFGFSSESSWVPDVQSDFPQEMNFWRRAQNTLVPIYNYLYHRWIYHPRLEEIMRKELNMPDMPSVFEMLGNVSIVLINTHYTTDYARSLPPHFIPIAGMVTQGTRVTLLSKEISKFIDSSKDGFVYVSFGSAVQVSKLTAEYRNHFFYAFGNSSINFIWKYDGERPAEMPSNVYTGAWMPQQSILSHPKCRAFITHGGLGSMHEALQYGVPLIVMPIFVDQDYNAGKVVGLGYGLILEITTLTQAQLELSVKEITKYEKYKQRILEISTGFKDRQVSPLDSAVWWTEKVLRSSEFELSLLRPIGRNQPWYVRHLLDVWIFFFLLASLSGLSLVFLINKLAAGKSPPSQQRLSHKSKKN